MSDRDLVVARIRAGFAGTPHPGDAFLQGSFEGTEPFEVARALSGVTSWWQVDAGLLDALYTALAFLSEGGFRFFLPAYLVADLEGRLSTADPVFDLTHGFLDTTVAIGVGSAVHERRIGRSALVNPRRYGAMTWYDHARARLAVFTREEAEAIVGYLEFRRDADEHGIDAPAIVSALDAFWHERARSAPTNDDLRRHLDAEEAFLRDTETPPLDPPPG